MQHLNNTDTHNPHTICTQFSHNPHTHTNTETNKHNNMQHIQDNTEIEHTQRTQNNLSTEQHTEQCTQNSAHNYRTYSLDYYNEYAYIKNSNTIELYTILQDKV